MRGAESYGYEESIIYVGQIGESCSEELLETLFSQVASIVGVKIIREMGVTPYAFVEYEDHAGAAAAISAFNKRVVLGQELKVHWATLRHPTSRKHVCDYYHVYVGDLDPNTTVEILRRAFKDFGEIADVKLIRDPETLRCKGYGFVSFVNKMDAAKAIGVMNGQWLGSRSIKTGWGAKKTVENQSTSYEAVSRQAPPSNRTVYCGGIGQGCSVELMRQYFQEFGQIQQIKCFNEKAYAFITFAERSSAVKAIVARHGSSILGFTARCAWGRQVMGEAEDPNEAWTSVSFKETQSLKGCYAAAANPPSSLSEIVPGLPNKYYTGGGPLPGTTDNLCPPPDAGVGPLQSTPSSGPLNGPRLNRRPVLVPGNRGYPTFETFRPRESSASIEQNVL